MAILTIKIDDETLEKYRAMSPEAPQKAIETTLERFKNVPTASRALVVEDGDRKELEKLHGKLFETSADVLRWVKSLVEVNVLGVTVHMKAGQKRKLEAEAKAFRQPFEDYVEKRVQAAIDRAFGIF